MRVEKHRLMRLQEVLHVCRISRSTLYDSLAKGNFPEQVLIGRRAVAWRECDIEGWITSRPTVSEAERR